ncbi:MAG TPA: hypothetical protein VGI08_04175 [Diaminobutyricibacter sp.]
MSLTKKRKKELDQLRSAAEELWEEQQDLLARANAVAKEASRQVGHLNREEVAPRVHAGYHQYVRPGMEVPGRLAGAAKERFVGDVIPAVGSAIGTAMSMADYARDARARAYAGERPFTSRKVVEEKSGRGAGGAVAVVLGLIAAAGLLYAVWQTFRADDELWVADEEPASPASE